MRIPTEAEDRYQFYVRIADQCFASADDRRGFYATMKSLYEFGTADGEARSLFNNIYPHLDQLTSFLFAGETAKFSATPSSSDNDLQFQMVPAIIRKIQEEYHDSNTDIVFANAVRFSLIYNTMIIKVLVRDGGVIPRCVEPGMFGVYTENVPELSRQQAVAHSFYLSREAFEKDIWNHPRREQIMERINAAREDRGNQPDGLKRIITSASSPQVIGQVNMSMLNGNDSPQIKVQADILEIREVWIWDTEASDYKVCTIAQPDVVVYERYAKDIFIKGHHPFIQVCPNPDPFYFWGESEVKRLMPLQDMLNERMDQIRHLLNKQARPPRVGYGMGPQDDVMAAWNVPDAFIAAGEGNFSYKEAAPQMPQDLFSEVDRILMMFRETSGLSAVLQGQGERGVRSMGHANELARLGAARAKARALKIEDSLEALVHLYYKVLRVYCKDDLKMMDSSKFILKQASSNLSIKVDAHSASAAFTEDQKELAFSLFNAGVITPERLIQLAQPPMVESLLQDLKEEKTPFQQKQKAEQAQMQMQAQAQQQAQQGQPVDSGAKPRLKAV